MIALLTGPESEWSGWSARLPRWGWEVHRWLDEAAAPPALVPDAVLIAPGAPPAIERARWAAARWPDAAVWIVWTRPPAALQRALVVHGAFGSLCAEPTEFALLRLRASAGVRARRSSAGPRSDAGARPLAAHAGPASADAVPLFAGALAGGQRGSSSRPRRLGSGAPRAWPAAPVPVRRVAAAPWWAWPSGPVGTGAVDLAVVGPAPVDVVGLVDQWAQRRGAVLRLALGTPAAPPGNPRSEGAEWRVVAPGPDAAGRVGALARSWRRDGGLGTCLCVADARAPRVGVPDARLAIAASLSAAVCVAVTADLDGLCAGRAFLDHLVLHRSDSGVRLGTLALWLIEHGDRAGSDAELTAALGLPCMTVAEPGPSVGASR